MISITTKAQMNLVTGTFEFHENGQLKYRGNYIDGKHHGLWEIFHQNSQLHGRANYTDGKLDDLFEVFDEAGDLTRVEIWGSGELIEESKLLH